MEKDHPRCPKNNVTMKIISYLPFSVYLCVNVCCMCAGAKRSVKYPQTGVTSVCSHSVLKL